MSGGLGSSLPLLSATGGGGPPAPEIDAGVGVHDAITVTLRCNETDAFGIGVAPAMTQKWYIGRTISEVVRMQPQILSKLTYGWTVTEQLYVSQALNAAIPATLADTIGQHAAAVTCIGVTILQGLGIAEAPLPSLRYTQTLVQGIGQSAALLNFFGLTLSDAINIHEDVSVQFRANPVISDVVDITPHLATTLLVNVTLAEGVTVADDNLLQMIYDGQLADGIEMTIGYLSPSGQFSTWAMNTRTGAVTEYDNYEFNSFARIGNTYVGASSSGLYKLLGDDDDGAAIIAQLKSGFAQWAQSHFAMFQGVYLGMRGEGTWILKLDTGDGKIFSYQFNSRNQRTTKVHTGKGLRARYWAFELIGDGTDFDLDTIEFVPLIAKRRV